MRQNGKHSKHFRNFVGKLVAESKLGAEADHCLLFIIVQNAHH